MQIIDTSHIKRFPKEVSLGYSPISEDYTTYILSDKEKSEFRNFKNPGRQAEYLTARYLFRKMLEDLGYDTDKAELHKEEGGKPYAMIKNKRLFVSFSHSQQMVFCALSESLDIGVDTEILGRSIPQRVLNRVLNETEKQTLNSLDLLQIWTLKEAAVKCLGTGLRTNLNDVSISVEKNEEISARFNNDNLIEICSFRATNHQIALAYQSIYI
ncbi:4'-phosphopantetheinyl transferase family protein [Gracilimonas sp. Q87]|uniref:4'-phosphopantetheinyl transferase family protein n=1 Tax=Gracilimonas sp. Q87 TaxID=3384766 RepID=UPI0039842E24